MSLVDGGSGLRAVDSVEYVKNMVDYGLKESDDSDIKSKANSYQGKLGISREG